MQLLAVYTNPESHNAQRHRQTDGRTDGQQDDANSRSYCVAVRSAENVATMSLQMCQLSKRRERSAIIKDERGNVLCRVTVLTDEEREISRSQSTQTGSGQGL